MRYGYCVNMASDDAAGIGMGRVPALLDAGFDYVELPLAQMMALDGAEFEHVVRAPLRALGLPCAACNNLFPAGLRLTGPDAQAARAADYARRALDRAAALGAETVVFGSAGARNLPDGWDRARGRAQLLDALGMLAGEARARGIAVAVEPLNRLESNVLNTLGETLDFIMGAGKPPQAFCLADSYHFTLGNEDPAALQAAASHVRHAHAARTLGRAMPRCADDGLGAFLQALKRGGYTGTLSIEAYPSGDFAAEARRSLDFIKGYWDSL